MHASNLLTQRVYFKPLELIYKLRKSSVDVKAACANIQEVKL